MSPNTPQGKPLPGREACAVDCLARLSGVNYGSVLKLLYAIRAMEKGLNLPVSVIVDVDGIPDDPVSMRADQKPRIQATRATVKEVIRSGACESPVLRPQLARLRAGHSI